MVAQFRALIFSGIQWLNYAQEVIAERIAPYPDVIVPVTSFPPKIQFLCLNVNQVPSDLIESLYWCCVFLALRMVIGDRFFASIGEKILTNPKWDEQTRQSKFNTPKTSFFAFFFILKQSTYLFRVERFGAVVYKGLYFVIISGLFRSSLFLSTFFFLSSDSVIPLPYLM